jgi:hypothetical protein
LANAEQLNQRLLERQEQLVSLQTAVLDLWGRCQVWHDKDMTWAKPMSFYEVAPMTGDVRHHVMPA